MEAITDLDIITMVATLTTATTARDLLRRSQHLPLTPRLKLTPGTASMDTDTVSDTMVDTMATPTMATMARGLLMPRLPLLLKRMPRLIPGWFMDMDTALDTTAAMDTVATLTTA